MQTLTPDAYTDDHMDGLQVQLERIRRRIGEVAVQIRDRAANRQSGQGLYVSDSEVQAILSSPIVVHVPPEVKERPSVSDGQACAPAGGSGNPFQLLQKKFGLDAFDADVVLLCLLVQLFPDYAKVVAWLQDDITRKRPGVDLLLDLFAQGGKENVALRRRFLPGAPLIDHNLIVPAVDAVSGRRGNDGFFELDQRVFARLLGSSTIDPAIATAVRFLAPDAETEDDPAMLAFDDRLNTFLAARQRGENWLLNLQDAGAGSCDRLIARVADRHRLQTLEVRLSSIPAESDASMSEFVHRIARESVLRDAVVIWRDLPQGPESGTILQRWVHAMDGHFPLSFMMDCGDAAPGPLLRRTRYLQHRIEAPDHRSRAAAWKSAGASLLLAPAIGEQTYVELANFNLSSDQIRRAARLAHDRVRWRGKNEPVGESDLFEACRDVSSVHLGALAQRIESTSVWDDLVLPADRMQQLREIHDQARFHGVVYEQWGFRERIAYGRGLSVLFAGPSGTGKTMAASVLANALRLMLYRIDLSGVVSKYIGETEKNLERIFREAESSNAILFFDEADALFGKRSEVKDAHDRYANIEVGYLLQRMEAYEGMVILASNFKRNMDDAFVRRIRATVDFPSPGRAERLEIWRRIWPQAAPRAADLDLDYLAENLDITGGNIRNIALSAAFLAAAGGEKIGMAHVLHAARREFQKMGKVLTRDELGKFRLSAAGAQ